MGKLRGVREGVKLLNVGHFGVEKKVFKTNGRKVRTKTVFLKIKARVDIFKIIQVKKSGVFVFCVGYMVDG